MFYTCVVWLYLLLSKEEGSSPVSAITERRDMGLYEAPLAMSLLWFGMGTDYISQLYMCGMLVLFKGGFQHAC